MPADMLGATTVRRRDDGVQGFASLLRAEGAFAGMSWHDARHAATAIMFDAINRDDAGGAFRGESP